jgi:hypothetical protein
VRIGRGAVCCVPVPRSCAAKAVDVYALEELPPHQLFNFMKEIAVLKKAQLMERAHEHALAYAATHCTHTN